MRQKKVNKKYKDRLFRLIFHEKEDLLELYNAINGSDYTTVEDLEITTIEDVVYMGMKNDISFIIYDFLNLYEHQSTYSPNMPIRGFLYLSDLYRTYVEKHKLNLYGSKQIHLPFPQYIIFYNGKKEEPDRHELCLSDAFEKVKDEHTPCVECRARLLNINWGHNKELLEKCRKLKEYSQFVARIRNRLEEGEPLIETVEIIVDECIQEGILADILSKNRAEVCNVILTEYDAESHIAMEKEWSKEEGKAEGKAEDILDILSDLGQVPEGLRIKIMGERDLEVLRKWLKLACKAVSVEEFAQKI